ncbi:unnamed protein product [Auanema sp. JU1783]|nr:unnamed protein product [Auanema sp. JU1783]
MACESLRIPQIDSSILDEEYKQLALDQVESSIELLPYTISRKLDKIKPEISLMVDSCLWSTRLTEGASPGQLEEDISYKDYNKSKVLIHYCWSILLPYFTRRATSLSKNRKMDAFLRKAEAVCEIFSLVYYLKFLRRGGHSTLTEYILGLRNWNNNLPTIGTINYESQNRELLWHAFRDGLQLAWPFGAFLHRYWLRYTKTTSMKHNEDNSVCGVCAKTAIIPVIWSPCEHVACYWCDRSRKERINNCAVCDKEGVSKFKIGEKLKS